MPRPIRATITAALALLAAAAPSALAPEVGECAPQKPGAYSDSACRVPASPGNHVWRELQPPLNAYTDGHPEVLGDEPQTFAGEGVTLRCKGQVVVGEVTSFTTNTQFAHDYKCELLAPFRAKCGNVGVEQIDTMPEAGVFSDGPNNTVVDTLSVSASFTCGGLPASIEGTYTGTLANRGSALAEPIVNKRIHKYDLVTGATWGAQALTLTVGLQTWPVTMSGEQEDRMGSAYLVVATGSRP